MSTSSRETGSSSSRSRPRAGGATRVVEVPATPGAERATRVIWIALVVLAALRAILPFSHTTWAWALSLQRFLDPLPGWGLWAIATLALGPAVARRVAGAHAGLGDGLARGWVFPAMWMAFAAALVWLLPDRVRFVGDFLLRQGTVELAEKPAVLFPQALPLDVLLHYKLPLFLVNQAWTDPNTAARLLGAIEAALLAWLAVMFVRTLDLRGVAAAATPDVIFFGGYPGMFTGYGKAMSELVLVNAAVGVFALRVVRTGRGLLPLGIAFALGVALHRSALSLVPVVALAWGFWLRANGFRALLRKPEAIAGLVIPIAALAVFLPRIITAVMRFEGVHFTPAEVQSGGGIWRAALAGTRPADFLNLLLVLSPLAIAIPFAIGAYGRDLPRGRELMVLATLALPLVLIAPFIHPAQGLFRDWDDFASAGVALSMIAAWLVGESLRDTRRYAWLGVAVMFGLGIPAIQWLAIHAETRRGQARVAAFVLEPPRRTDAERGKTWDYLGIVSYRAERWEDAAEAFAKASETAPSPRILLEWAMSETNRGNLRKAQEVYRRHLKEQPESFFGWLGLGAVSIRLADSEEKGSQQEADVAEARRAAAEVLKIQPGTPQAQRMVDYLNGRYPLAR